MKQSYKNYYKHIFLEKKSTLDCVIRILSKLFLNQQEGVSETSET